MKTRIGILGYGNLGKGVECAVKEANDMNQLLYLDRKSTRLNSSHPSSSRMPSSA